MIEVRVSMSEFGSASWFGVKGSSLCRESASSFPSWFSIRVWFSVGRQGVVVRYRRSDLRRGLVSRFGLVLLGVGVGIGVGNQARRLGNRVWCWDWRQGEVQRHGLASGFVSVSDRRLGLASGFCVGFSVEVRLGVLVQRWDRFVLRKSLGYVSCKYYSLQSSGYQMLL